MQYHILYWQRNMTDQYFLFLFYNILMLFQVQGENVQHTDDATEFK